MIKVFGFIYIFMISQIASELCPEYSVVFKYTESVRGQPFWVPLLPEDQDSPELKAIREKSKNCVLDLDCGDQPINMTKLGIVFTHEDLQHDTDLQNDDNGASDDPENCPAGEDCEKSVEELYPFVECDAIGSNDYSNKTRIMVVPDDQCNEDCFVVSKDDDKCTDKAKGCMTVAKDKVTADVTTNTPLKEVTDEEIDNTTTELVMPGETAAKEADEKNLTGTFIVVGIISVAAICALLYLAVKMIAAYFKAKSYSIADAEAKRNQPRDSSDE